MLLDFVAVGMVALFVSLGVYGVLLMRQSGRRRVAGGVLVAESLLLLGTFVFLTTFPFGIGEPLIRVRLEETLLLTAIGLAAVAAAIAVVYAGARVFLRRRARVSGSGPAVAGLLIILPLLAFVCFYALARISLPERERERDPSKRVIELASGFTWNIYAQGTMDNPTAIAFGPDGRLYIADIAGSLWVANDADGDGTAESLQRYADGFSLLVGLVWHQDELYTASSGKIEALRDSDGDGVADQRRLVVEGLPSMVLRPHSNNGIGIGPDGRLYFGVGSTTSGQFEQDEHAAAILSVNPDGSDLRVFARGLGNSFDVAFNANGDLFAGDNSPIGDGEELPDEFNYIVEGEHYGFPYFYGDPPENGGTRGAIVSFPPHSVPTGMTFYSADQYPDPYHDNAFVTLWGRGEIARVEVGRTASGDYLGRTVTFGSGFLYPIDAITGPDGNLYVADFGTSAVYRITYDPNKAW